MMNKRNKLDIAPKGLILAVTVIIALILSAISLYMVTRGKSTINDGNAQYTDMMSAYSEINATMYDGLIVAGDKVYELASTEANKGTQSTVAIWVITEAQKPAAGTAITYPVNGTAWTAPTAGAGYGGSAAGITTTGTIANAAGKEHINLADYINPNASFAGKVHKNQNNVVDAIIFTQQ